jgi:cell filamentation protein
LCGNDDDAPGKCTGAHACGTGPDFHPFREGNGRCARLLAYLMAIQAGLPSLDFSGLAGRGKRMYIAAIQAAVGGNYLPLETLFAAAIRRTLAAYERRP